ncbi:hypothetical protein [Agrobacterium tumefaciens]|uniref:hypothetical protein n=1 Tax=Agrobacterium tumefaciens TaxID=358 RepID=UPI0021D0148E|nr:hypothetical protein [Agrobacterium tumefaciens]UXT99934.1 hypothetical protein FY129_21015 [Agrobacterium tumefaciens]
MTFWTAISLIIIVLSLALKPLRVWLESCADQAKRQGILVEMYYRNATRFLQLSNPKQHAEVREITVWMGQKMLKGTFLIQSLILTRMKNQDQDSDTRASADDVFGGAPEEAAHSFAKAMGSALLASSYQSFFFGGKYRAMLQLLLMPKEKEIKDPGQLVFRYRKTHNLSHQILKRSA